jgi:hypothetical protein
MKINISVQINNNNEAEIQAVTTCKQYWNLAKAYLPILASHQDAKELIQAMNECKPYCTTSAEEQNNRTIYTFTYDDENENVATNTTDATANIASLAAELLGVK